MNFQLLSSAAAPSGNNAGNILFTVGYIAVFGVIIYFILIRPQRKKQKAEEKMRSNVQVGDEIITIGGLYGRVISIKDDSLIIESSNDRSKNRIAKWAIQTNLTIHDE